MKLPDDGIGFSEHVLGVCNQKFLDVLGGLVQITAMCSQHYVQDVLDYLRLSERAALSLGAFASTPALFSDIAFPAKRRLSVAAG
jgi:hypothetical protein